MPRLPSAPGTWAPGTALLLAALLLASLALPLIALPRAQAASAAADSSAPTLAADSAYARPVVPPPGARVAEWETLETGLPEEVRLRPIGGFRMNRVDGFAITVGGAFQTARSPAPALFAQVTGTTERRNVLLAEAGFELPLGDRPWLQIGASAHRRTATEDEWIVGELENTLFALFARTDYRDYYDAKGARGYLAWNPGSDVTVRADVRFEAQKSLRGRDVFSLLGKHGDFRPNPAIRDGDEQALAVTCRIGPKTLPQRGGAHGELTYERSGDPLEGDYEYGRLRAVAQSRFRISNTRSARVRVIGGSTRSGALPVQRVWHVGGIGTMRGHDYKFYSGDQFFVATAEHQVRARKNVYPFWFVDYGAAWFGRANLGRQRPGMDGGMGVRLGEDWVSLTVAKDLRNSKSKFLVGVRILGTF
jgi:hypothetical protein